MFTCLAGKAWITNPDWTPNTYEFDFSTSTPKVFPEDNTGKLWEILSLRQEGFRLNSYGAFFLYANGVKPQSNVNATVKGPVITKHENNAGQNFLVCGGNNGDLPIKKVTITDVNIEDGEGKPTTSYRNDSSESVSEATGAPNNGLKYYEYVAEPKIPISSFILYADKFCSTIPTGEFKYSYLGTKELVSGFVVTKIKIEYYQVRGQDSGFMDFLNKASEAFDNQADIESRDYIRDLDAELLAKHYRKTASADVNEDGTVNSADVVSIYNRIAFGSGTPMADGKEYVDLGLPSKTLWATCNVGASVPESFGDFYAFRECEHGFLSGKHIFNRNTWTPVRTNKDHRYSGWGDNWTVPTDSQVSELISNCLWNLIKVNDVKCLVFTSKINGRKLTLPLAGAVYDDKGYVRMNTSDNGYWTCSGSSTGFNSQALVFPNNIPQLDTRTYHRGFPVRLVHNPL